MAHFKIQDVHALENSPTSPGTLKNKLGEMIVSSMNCRAKVDALNPETGEYRVVLQGTLDKEDTRWDQS